MEIPSSTSPLFYIASRSSLSLYSSDRSQTGKMKAKAAVAFWYEDDAEDLAPAPTERFSCSFLEECRLCKRRMGAGRDAYMFAGEAAFCSEECRQEWIELKDASSQEKIRRKTVETVKACRSSRIPAPELCIPAARYTAGGALVAV